MAIDVGRFLKNVKAKREHARGTVAMYLDKPLFKKFQDTCRAQGVSASRAFEELMRDFVESAEMTSSEMHPKQQRLIDLILKLPVGELDDLGFDRTITKRLRDLGLISSDQSPSNRSNKNRV